MAYNLLFDRYFFSKPCIASTQPQALCAILFLYKQVLLREWTFPQFNAVRRQGQTVRETQTRRLGRIDEWHVDIGKSPRENEMGEKGLSCSDGFDYEPIFGKEAQRCDFLTTDGFANK